MWHVIAQFMPKTVCMICVQDWNYVQARCMEITLELSPTKWPAPDTLGALFDANLDAMLALPLAAMFGGVRYGSATPAGSPPPPTTTFGVIDP